jgi:hypothetical protein
MGIVAGMGQGRRILTADFLHPGAGPARPIFMATRIFPPDLQSSPAVDPVLSVLRLEGLAAAALSAVFYARTGANWGLFAALWLAPDLSLLGYLAGPNWGARIYNAIHAYITPATLAVTALLLHSDAPLPFALIWINHIGVDRMMGYGLKFQEGFAWTHLGKLGGRHGTPTEPRRADPRFAAAGPAQPAKRQS